MANLEGMPIGSLPELTGDLQDEDEVVVYRPSTGKAYQANTDLIDSSYNLPIYVFSTSSSVLDQAVEVMTDGSNRHILFGYSGASANTDAPSSGGNYFYVFVQMNTASTAVNAFAWMQNSTNMYIRLRASSTWADSWTRLSIT